MKRNTGDKLIWIRNDGTEHECEILSINGYHPPTGSEHYTLKILSTGEVINSAWEKERRAV